MWLASQGCGWGEAQSPTPQNSPPQAVPIHSSPDQYIYQELFPASAVTLLSSCMAPSRVRRVSTSSGSSLPWEGDVEVEDITPPPSPPPLPAGVPQGDPHVNQIIITVSDSSESEDDGFIEVLQVDRYWDRARPPACRRRDDQPPCQGVNRSCRRAVAVLAMEAGLLSFESQERNLQVSVPVSPGLSYFTWCSSNLFCRGLVPLSVTALPPPYPGIPEFLVGSALPGFTWMRVLTSFGPFQPAVRSYVFHTELSLPSLLACLFSGPVPAALLSNPVPHVNLEALLPANYYFVSMHSIPEDGPLLASEGGHIVDV